MGQYLAWSIPWTKGFQFVQIKSLRSYIAPHQGLKLLHIDKKEMLKQFSSQELLHQMGYLAWNIPGQGYSTLFQ